MSKRVPSFFLLVPGPWRQARDVVDALCQQGIDINPRADKPVAGEVYVDVVHDDALADGFGWGRDGELSSILVESVAACRSAALIEVAHRLDEIAPLRLAQLGRALQAAGGVAVRMEGSGSASDWESWLELLDIGFPQHVYSAAVTLVRDGESYFTCGMHQFDFPDSEISGVDGSTASHWLDTFSVYQVAEKPVLASGHTFQPDAQHLRRKIERWPDHRHHPDDGRHNPFGLWRFLPEGADGLEATRQKAFIVPSLVSILLSTERSRGWPLERGEVEEVVGQAPAISMKVEDAFAMERSRGYADIEPELAWSQWQIVRERFV